MTLCLSCTPQVDQSKIEAAQKRYLLGADYYHKQLIPAALEELREALSLDPKNADALYLSGLIAMRQGVEAQDLAVRAQCLPEAEARMERQDADRKMREAEALFRRALAERPAYAEAWNALAAVALHFRRWDDALRHSERALSNATYVTPWFALANQGVAYQEKRDYLRAARVLRQALQQNQKFCVARWRLGQVYFAQADLERASQELGILAGDETCPIQEAYLLYGRVLEKLNDPTRAEEIFGQCRRLGPKSCVAKECRLAN